jgi:hypothetical protein
MPFAVRALTGYPAATPARRDFEALLCRAMRSIELGVSVWRPRFELGVAVFPLHRTSINDGVLAEPDDAEASPCIPPVGLVALQSFDMPSGPRVVRASPRRLTGAPFPTRWCALRTTVPCLFRNRFILSCVHSPSESLRLPPGSLLAK